jgi:hypothetical protein
MVSIRFHDVYVGAHPGYDGHVVAYVDKYDGCRGVLSFWHFYEGGEYFFYADLLFCEDIQTIVMLDYYAFHRHEIVADDDFVPYIHIPRQAKMKACMTHSIREIFEKIYPGKTLLHYNKGHVQALQKDIQTQLRHKTNVLAKVLPWDIVDAVYDTMEPAWTRHQRHYWPRRWDTYKATREVRADSKRAFYNGWDGLRDVLRRSVRDNCVYIGKMARVVA